MSPRKKKLISAVIITTILLIIVFGFVSDVLAQGAGVSAETGHSGVTGEVISGTSITGTTPTPVTSESKTGTESAIGNVVGWILFYIAQFFSYLVNLLIGTMVEVVAYNDFNIDMVKSGWSIVRDVANNFFIIILLVIAVLINFSKMFTLILIDFSQIITLWFASAIREVGNQGNIMLYALGLHDLYNIDASTKDWTDSMGLNDQSVIKVMLFAIILSVVAAVVVAIIIIILVYRIVMLWFLVILSPLAFLLTAFPKGQQYAGMWWSELSKYLVVGPVMLFFLYLSFFSKSTL